MQGVQIMDDSISRFLDKYILKTVSYNVPEPVRRWYVRHVEAFIKVHSGRCLAAIASLELVKYLDEKGRNEKLEKIKESDFLRRGLEHCCCKYASHPSRPTNSYF